MDNPDLEKALKEVGAKVVTRKASDHRSIYANVCRTNTGPWDISLIFALMVETEGGSPGQAHPEDLVTVILSPEEAKAVAGIVASAVQSYEQAYGPIKDLTALLTEKFAAKSQPSN